MANRRFDEIGVAPSINLANSYFIVTQFTGGGGSGYTDYRFNVAALFGKLKTIVVEMAADSTTIVNNLLENAVDVRVSALGSGMLINAAYTSYNQAGVPVTLPNPAGNRFAFNSGTGTITFNSTRIASEVFIIQYIEP